jgi:uncharacterized protein YebE (UPF0316 family)
MNFLSFLSSSTAVWVLPLFIFLARIIDVSMGTIRVIFIARGMKFLAPLLGFFEVLVWLLAIGQIMQNLTNFVSYLAYAGGFSLGTFVGINIESRLSLGVVLFRIITQREASELIDWLKSEHYGVTVVPAEGAKGSVRIIFTVIKRRDITTVARRIEQLNPSAFYSIEDVRFVSEGVFPLPKPRSQKLSLRLLRLTRKGK